LLVPGRRRGGGDLAIGMLAAVHPAPAEAARANTVAESPSWSGLSRLRQPAHPGIRPRSLRTPGRTRLPPSRSAGARRLPTDRTCRLAIDPRYLIRDNRVTLRQNQRRTSVKTCAAPGPHGVEAERSRPAPRCGTAGGACGS